MNIETACASFIHTEINPTQSPYLGRGAIPKCAITLSREAGCGAHAFAEKLVRRLGSLAPPGAVPWTVFDRNLVETVLADHHLPDSLARYMPEDRVLEIDDIIDELVGLHPSSWSLIEKTSETILRLANMGNVIILGRAANIITASVPHMLHLRMIGSEARRIESMQKFENLPLREAAERVHREDLGRERYVRKHFHKDARDPLLYHLIINTDLVPQEQALDVVVDLVQKRRLVAAATAPARVTI